MSIKKKKDTFYILFTIVLLILIVGGFFYIKTNGIFDKNTMYKVKFENVTGLSPGAAVTLRGVKIGRVADIVVDKEKPRFVVAELKIRKRFRIHKDAVIVMRSGGLMDGNILAVEFDEHCSGENCAEKGFMFKTRTAGMMESMFGKNPMEDEFGIEKEDVDEMMETWKTKIMGEDSDHVIGVTLRNINFINTAMADLGKEMDGVTKRAAGEYKEIMENLDGLEQIMKDDKVDQINNDLEMISKKMEEVDLRKPMDHAERTMAKVAELKKKAGIRMEELNTTMAKSKETFKSFDEIEEKMGSGEGSVKYLMEKDGLATDLNETTDNLNRLGDDMSKNTFYYKPFLWRRKFLRKNPDKR